MIKHADSHLDHNLTPAQVEYLMQRFADRSAFFVETLELPPELGTVPCGLHGPITGDPPIHNDEVTMARRPPRAWKSRLVDRQPKLVRTVTVVAGPHDGHACVVFTMYGGPSAPPEPADIRKQLEVLEAKRGPLHSQPEKRAEHDEIYGQIVILREKRAESDVFWSAHALSRPKPEPIKETTPP